MRIITEASYAAYDMPHKIHFMIPKRNVSGSDLYHHCNVSSQRSDIYPDRKDQVKGSIWSTSLWTLPAVDFIHRCFKVRPNYFRIFTLVLYFESQQKPSIE